MIYKVPLPLLPSYPTENLAVRSSDSAALVKAALDDGSGRIKSVQLLAPGRGIEELRDLPPSVQVDLCLTEASPDKGTLLPWRKVLEGQAVRLVVPVVAGFSDVVKEALQAGLRVGLEIDQPQTGLVKELQDCFVFFIREADVKEPVDLFYGLFRSFLTKKVESLWQIQEEHPASYRYVTDTGEVTLSERLANATQGANLETFMADHKLNLFVRKEECCSCRFFSHCEGYFKLPKDGYSCSAIKDFLNQILESSAELRADLAQAPDSSRVSL
ncbi:MAG: hypothetical protein HY913_03215 [Desulfomonile tiedjei]|nr:hypothetical protein [Desulfomonile tiedjei]